MNVRECYELIKGDYEEIKRRFLTDARIRRFALLFLKDCSMDDLRAAMDAKDCGNAFQAAHTLKGVCLNLGLDGLYGPVNKITEMLRAGDLESAAEEMEFVEKEYGTTFQALKELERS